MKKEKTLSKKMGYWAGVIAVGAALGFALQFAKAWTEPTVAPPNANVGAPINVGVNEQVKAGALGVQGVFHGYSNGYFDGNVGIGTITPSEKLDVNGNIHISDHMAIKWGGGSAKIEGENPNNMLHFFTNSIERMIIDNDGTIGMGTTNPNNPLHIFSATNNHALAVETTSGEAEMVLGDSKNSQYWEMGASSVGYHIGDLVHNMYTIVIKGDGTGNVGIGTGNPTAKLEVAGTAGVDGIKFPDGTLQTTAATGGGNFGGMFQMGESDQGYDSGDMSTMKDPNFPSSWDGFGRHCENVNPKTGKCNCPSGYTEAVGGFIAENPGVCASGKCWDEGHYCYK